jgi:hypothetical protein
MVAPEWLATDRTKAKTEPESLLVTYLRRCYDPTTCRLVCAFAVIKKEWVGCDAYETVTDCYTSDIAHDLSPGGLLALAARLPLPQIEVAGPGGLIASGRLSLSSYIGMFDYAVAPIPEHRVQQLIRAAMDSTKR